MIMRSDYRLFCQGGGRGAYAHVFVEGTRGGPSGRSVLLELQTHVGSFGTNQPDDSSLVEAAVAGCYAAISWRSSNLDLHVSIKRIGTSIVDTTPEAVAVSACIATLQMVHEDGRFQPRWFEGHWGVWDSSNGELLPLGANIFHLSPEKVK